MFIAIPTTISARIFFFLDTGKIILKFIWKYMGPKTAKTILRKNIVGGIILSNFKLHSYNNHECGFGRIDPQISGTK